MPGLEPLATSVRIGPVPIDLGGIGKGLAVRWAAQVLSASGSHLVEAGGDCYLGGDGPDGDGWPVGVENPDPDGVPEHVAVLRLRDLGCATSSLRVRSWRVGGEQVHHVIDPRTGRSARSGLRSVTVVDPDPARAEVWSKALLVAGSARIGGLASGRSLAALWVDDDGRLSYSEAMRPWVIWEAPDEQ
jgi:thiamine biosynthesis lipoprotein